MLKRTIWLAPIFLLSLSCSNPSAEEVDQARSLRKTDIMLELAIDSVTANISTFLTYYDDGQNETGYLFSINSQNNSLQLYDLTNETLVRAIPFETDGERGVGRLEGIYVSDFENILLFPSQVNRLYLIDATGSLFQKIEYELPEGYSNAQVSSSFFAATPSLENGKLTAQTIYLGNYRSISNEELAMKHTGYIIDLQTGKTEMLPHFFPADYYGLGIKHFKFSSVQTEKGAIYSFFGDHHLYYSETLNAPLKKKEARSQYINQVIESFPASGNALDRARYYSASSHYGSLLHDPYRKVFYRFCYPEVEINDMQALRNNIQYPQKFSIMVLNEDLNILGETLFDDNTELVPQNAFVGKKGLYLSVNHAENLLNDEGYFKFRLLKLD